VILSTKVVLQRGVRTIPGYGVISISGLVPERDEACILMIKRGWFIQYLDSISEDIMAIRTLTYPRTTVHRSIIRPYLMKLEEWISCHTPRPCMILSVGLLLLGLFVPLLMLLEIIPSSLLFGFFGFALTFSGGVMALYYWGEL
jgi:hypothetical protein